MFLPSTDDDFADVMCWFIKGNQLFSFYSAFRLCFFLQRNKPLTSSSRSSKSSSTEPDSPTSSNSAFSVAMSVSSKYTPRGRCCASPHSCTATVTYCFCHAVPEQPPDVTSIPRIPSSTHTRKSDFSPLNISIPCSIDCDIRSSGRYWRNLFISLVQFWKVSGLIAQRGL